MSKAISSAEVTSGEDGESSDNKGSCRLIDDDSAPADYTRRTSSNSYNLGSREWFTKKDYDEPENAKGSARLRERLRIEAEISHDVLTLYSAGTNVSTPNMCATCTGARDQLAKIRARRSNKFVKEKRAAVDSCKDVLSEITVELNGSGYLDDPFRELLLKLVEGGGNASAFLSAARVDSNSTPGAVPCARTIGRERALVAAASVGASVDALNELTAPVSPTEYVSCKKCAYGRAMYYVATRLLRVFTTPESYRLIRNFSDMAGPEEFDRSHGCGSCGMAMSRVTAFGPKGSIAWLPGDADTNVDSRLRRATTHSVACEDCNVGINPYCKFRVLSSGYLCGGRYSMLSPLIYPVLPFMNAPRLVNQVNIMARVSLIY